MYTHILFDMDDTLLDFQKAEYESFKRVLFFYNIPFSLELYEQYKSINHSLWKQFEAGQLSKVVVQNERFSAFFNCLNKRINGESANSMYQVFLSEQTWTVPHAKKVCMELSKTHSLSIVTNGVGKTQMNRFTLSELSPFFSHLIISEDIGVAKPDKRFFDAAFKIIGRTDNKKVLLVGDSLSSDILGAFNAKIDCCWFNPNKRAPDINVSFTYEISNLMQLLDIIKQ